MDISLPLSIKVIPVRSSSVLSHISSPSGSPGSTHSLCSPRSLRKKECSLEELLSSSPPAHKARILRMPSHLPRDSTQPMSGSLSHSGSTENIDDEERDEFSAMYSQRPRSSTCPESRAWKRHLKVRAERQPASPPACGIEVCQLSQQLSCIAMKAQLHIPQRDLPLLLE